MRTLMTTPPEGKASQNGNRSRLAVAEIETLFGHISLSLLGSFVPRRFFARLNHRPPREGLPRHTLVVDVADEKTVWLAGGSCSEENGASLSLPPSARSGGGPSPVPGRREIANGNRLQEQRSRRQIVGGGVASLGTEEGSKGRPS